MLRRSLLSKRKKISCFACLKKQFECFYGSLSKITVRKAIKQLKRRMKTIIIVDIHLSMNKQATRWIINHVLSQLWLNINFRFSIEGSSYSTIEWYTMKTVLCAFLLIIGIIYVQAEDNATQVKPNVSSSSARLRFYTSSQSGSLWKIWKKNKYLFFCRIMKTTQKFASFATAIRRRNM